MAIDLGIIFVPLTIVGLFCEETKLGRKLTRWALIKLGVWDPEWDEDNEDNEDNK